LYYSPKAKNEGFLEDEVIKIYLDRPFYGYRRIYRDLIKRNINIGEKKVRIIKKRLNLKTLYPKPYLSIPNKEHEKHPYLLKNKEITSVNQVWQTDITYLKLKTGFAYLAAVIDVFSRKTLSYRISNTMDVAFCKDVINNAIIKYGTPEIVNSDQGSQYTSLEFVSLLKENNIKISMNSKGRALDNIFVERLFRSLKYEDVYLKKYGSITEAATGIKDYFNFYNTDRGHQSLGYRTPDEVYYGSVKQVA
jgi:putative transposase